MSLPEAMSRAKRDQPAPVSIKNLGLLIAMLILLGVAGTAASIYSARTTVGATKADVERNRVLLQRVADLEQMNSAEQEQHRQRNEALHEDLCRIIFDITQQVPRLAGKVEPCRPPVR